MKHEKVEVYLHAQLTLALDGGEWLASYPKHLTHGKEYPLDSSLGGSQSQSGHSGKEKQPLHLQEPI
jgi:hypothetical protein